MNVKQTRGQGLIEILIAMVIISGCIVTLLRFQNRIAYNNAILRQQSEATILAVKKIESLRNFQVITTQAPFTAYSSIASGTSSITATTTTYNLTWTVSTLTNPNYKLVDVVVRWTDRYGGAQLIRFVTYIASLDPALSGSIY